MIFRQKLSSKRKKTLLLFEQIIHLQALNLPLQTCLARLLQIQKSPGLEQILIELEHGLDLNQALEKADAYFDPIGLALLKLAAHSPFPDRGLKLYIEQAQQKQKIQQKMIEASFYPLLLLCLLLLVISIFQTQVFPAYQGLAQTFAVLKPQAEFHFSSIFIILGLLIGLLSHKKIRNQLPWFSQFQAHFDWLFWLQIMTLAGDSGLNFSQALDFTLPYIQNHSVYSWHIKIRQELAFGNPEYIFPHSMPAITKNILALMQFSPNWRQIFSQAARVIASEIEVKLARIERYLQPLLLLIMTAGCGYIAKLIYTPLLQLGDAIL